MMAKSGKMVKKGIAALSIVFIAVFAIVAFLPLVSAENMQITVQTLPRVLSAQINVINPNTGDAIRSLSNDTDSSGKVVFNYVAPIASVSFYVIIREDGKIILTKRTGNYVSSYGPLTIEVLPAASVSSTATSSANTSAVSANTSASTAANTTNTTTTMTAAATNASNQTSKLMLALSSFMGKTAEKFRSYMWYIIGIVIVGGVAYFIIFAVRHKERFKIFKKREPSFVEIKPRAKGELRAEPRDAKEAGTGNMDKRLAEAERKIREAQDEIERIRNRKQMVSEAEKKFEEAKRELEKLKKGI